MWSEPLQELLSVAKDAETNTAFGLPPKVDTEALRSLIAKYNVAGELVAAVTACSLCHHNEQCPYAGDTEFDGWGVAPECW